MAKKPVKSKTKNKGGRPSVITDEVLLKLEEAFALDCTDLEACLFAGISKSALYHYQEGNEEFKERKQLLKETVVLAARTTVSKEVKINADMALKYLERKKKSEFSLRVENTGADGDPIKLEHQSVVFNPVGGDET